MHVSRVCTYNGNECKSGIVASCTSTGEFKAVEGWLYSTIWVIFTIPESSYGDFLKWVTSEGKGQSKVGAPPLSSRTSRKLIQLG